MPTRTRNRPWSTALILGQLLALACSDDGPTGNTGGDYSLTVTPGALSIVAGGSSSATVTIVRTNFTGEVSLALQNPPAGITGVFTPTPTTASGSAVAISVAATVAPGSHALTIQGSASGPGTKTATLTVTVPQPPAGGNVQYQFCSAPAVPAFVAFQDGTGPWQAVTGSASGGTTRFTMNLTQGRGGVMFVQQTAPGEYLTEVRYASTAELAQDASESCAQTGATKTVTGTVAGVPAGSYGIVTFGTTEIFDGAASTNPVTFTDVPAGPLDLVGSLTIPGNPPSRIIISRNLNVADGGSLPSVIDFNGPASFAPATATATITGGAGDNLEIFVDLVTANTQAGLWFDLSPSPTAARPWAGLAPAQMVSGDLHALIVFASPTTASGDFRVALKYVGPVSNQTLGLGPTLGLPVTTQIAAGAYPRFRFQGTLPAEYNKGAAIDLLHASGSGSVLSILATSAWLAAAGNPLAYDITMPDVSGLSGFPVASRLTAGLSLVAASGFGFTGTGVFEVRPSLGSEFRAATKGTTITVP
ncbi:MAG TPA: hypothetical protein VLB00_08760 [Gemmatimonadales bacterium]|nr:hypothetical protein [Gemmatimonadales bacterium]